MKLSGSVIALFVVARLAAADGTWQLLPDPQGQCVFAGDARKINVAWRNTGDRTVESEVHMRIFQATSATAVLWRESSWKRLELLPGQTVVDAITLDFPPVTAVTRFVVQWVAGTNEVMGVTDVRVYPTNLLAELPVLAKHQPIGLFDPENELKPLLKSLRIEFIDLDTVNFTNFTGQLAIVGPFASRTQIRDGLAEQIRWAAKKGADIIWFRPPDGHTGQLVPSFYSVPEKAGSVWVVQPELVAGLADSPRAQRNLISLCRLALNPQPLTLPELSGP
jgi:hypothetical protein